MLAWKIGVKQNPSRRQSSGECATSQSCTVLAGGLNSFPPFHYYHPLFKTHWQLLPANSEPMVIELTLTSS